MARQSITEAVSAAITARGYGSHLDSEPYRSLVGEVVRSLVVREDQIRTDLISEVRYYDEGLVPQFIAILDKAGLGDATEVVIAVDGESQTLRGDRAHRVLEILREQD